MNDIENNEDHLEASLAALRRLAVLSVELTEAQRLGWGPTGRTVNDAQAIAKAWKRRDPRAKPLAIKRELLPEAQHSIDSIRRTLDALAANDSRSLQPTADGTAITETSWCFCRLLVIDEARPALRGYIEPRETTFIAKNLPVPVLLYLIAVPNTRDYVEREIHGTQWGYHYHYLNAKKRRSDTLLTFDSQLDAQGRARLYWERHAEAQSFKARAASWGVHKRRDVYDVCHPDTRKWPLSAFKRPSTTAEAVWPDA